MNDKTIIGPVWVTKHALTSPIQRLEQVTVNGDMITWYQGDGLYMDHAHREGRDWHRTEESAHARVSVMVDAKSKGIDKQRVKLVRLLENGAKVVAAAGRPTR
jgi:hypothetical protein